MASNPFKFAQSVRSEVAKIHWPSRRETVLTTIMVFVMTAIFMLFFGLVDLLIRSGVEGLLEIFR